MGDEEKIDLRAKRTQNWLHKALKKLIKQKAYKDIQVSEITKNANVSRPTFYLHYQSKDDLLSSILDDVFNDCFEKIESIDPERDFSLNTIEEMFRFWKNHIDTINLIFEAELDMLLLKKIKNYIQEMAYLALEKRNQKNLKTERHEYIIDFLSGGIYMLLKKWILSKNPLSEKDLAILLKNVTDSFQIFAEDNDQQI